MNDAYSKTNDTTKDESQAVEKDASKEHAETEAGSKGGQSETKNPNKTATDFEDSDDTTSTM